MSASLQKIELIGHLGKDPEMKAMPSGNFVTNFSVATSRKWKDANDVDQEETIWWRAAAYGKTAENCNQYLKKGSLVHIEGRMVPDNKTHGPKIYTKTDGSSGAGYDLCVEKILFLNGPRDGASNGAFPDDADEYGNPIGAGASAQSSTPAQTMGEDNFPI